MARPRSEDKQKAILDAAVEEFAVRGVWSTPTSAISKTAGVAEGTLFTYFTSKDVLVNALYRALKLELADAMMGDYPHAAPARDKFRHVWTRYLGWASANPLKCKVMGQLRVSDRITPETRDAGSAPFVELLREAETCVRQKLVRDYPVQFIGAMFSGLADATLATLAAMAEPDGSGLDPVAAGFDVFWNGIALKEIE